jgi:phosphoglucomutase
VPLLCDLCVHYQIITKIAVANGVVRINIAKDGLLSTPATSALIREKGPVYVHHPSPHPTSQNTGWKLMDRVLALVG